MVGMRQRSACRVTRTFDLYLCEYENTGSGIHHAHGVKAGGHNHLRYMLMRLSVCAGSEAYAPGRACVQEERTVAVYGAECALSRAEGGWRAGRAFGQRNEGIRRASSLGSVAHRPTPSRAGRSWRLNS